MTEKSCRICGEQKPLDDFHRDASLRDGHKSACKSCLCARARGYMVEWRQAHPGYAPRSGKKWRIANPEGWRAIRARSYLKHRDRRLSETNAWRRNNPELRKRYGRLWRERNPEKVREKTRRRNARKRGVAAGRVDYDAIYRRDGEFCYLCWEPVAKDDAQFDHVVPISRGGSHAAENIRATHAWCNRLKSNKDLAVAVSG
jgi:5-methylcytosine-specific restriction endonuclease McrA